MRTSNKSLRRLVRECIENDGTQSKANDIAILSMQEIVDIIMLTIAALNSGEVYISESQKGKDKRYSHTSPRANRMSSSRYLHK